MLVKALSALYRGSFDRLLFSGPLDDSANGKNDLNKNNLKSGPPHCKKGYKTQVYFSF